VNQISPITSLLLDRTVAMLMTCPAEDKKHSHRHFVVISGKMIGTGNPNLERVMLTQVEFLEMFGPQNQLQ
jgi:hypothetical protein